MSDLETTSPRVNRDGSPVLPSRVIRNKLHLLSTVSLLLIAPQPLWGQASRADWMPVAISIACLCMAGMGIVAYYAISITVTPTVLVLKSVRRTEVIASDGFLSIEQYRWGRFTAVSSTGESWAPFGSPKVTKQIKDAIVELQSA